MTIDANIIIAYVGGDNSVIEALSRWREEGRPLFLSTVVETEVLSFAKWTAEEHQDTEEFLSVNFTSVGFDRNLARAAAAIRRSVRINLPDAAIAATALYTGTPLVTRNVKDFRNIVGLKVLTI